MGTDTLSKIQGALLRDNHFRVWRETLNPMEAEMVSVKKLDRTELYGAKQNADQIKQLSAQIHPAFLSAVTRSIHG